MLKLVSILIICLTAVPGTSALAWDLVYDCGVLPNDISLGANQWTTYTSNDLSMCSTDGDVLHIADVSSEATAYFSRFVIPANSPTTVEARCRMASGTDVSLVAGTPSFCTGVSLYPDRLFVRISGGPSATYAADLSTFHTIRIATEAQGLTFIWLDNALVLCGTSTQSGNQGDIGFGSGYGLSDSYWDYVAYSNAFLPIPEPSSLLALLAGFGGLGVALRRRGR